MSGQTERRRQDLHDRLLTAAERMIARDGLPGLRARALAEEVGCSVGAIYGVFEDLDALIMAVNARTLEEIEATLAAADSDGGPAAHLTRLADAYLSYAVAHRPRWSALFAHRLSDGRSIAPEYAARQATAFAIIEAPLAALRPDLAAGPRALLARTLFAAVHGVAQLGLDEKVAAMTVPVLRGQLGLIVGAMARGLGR